MAALISLCPNRIDIAPLRHRTIELPALAGDVLTRVAPRATLGAAAGEALLACDWPGNLSELTMVLQTAADNAARRADQLISMADLPEQYQTTTRAHRLSGRDRAERQAIVEAMNAAGGNKVHAAKMLGISRSTLYTRLTRPRHLIPTPEIGGFWRPFPQVSLTKTHHFRVSGVVFKFRTVRHHKLLGL